MRYLLRLMLGAVVALGFTAPAAAAPIVSIQSPTGTFSPGESFTLDVVISGVVDLYAFQFDVTFDPDVFTVQAPTEGPFLATGGATFFVPGFDSTFGQLLFTGNTLLSPTAGVNGGGALAALHFVAANFTSPLLTAVTLSNVVLLDSNLATIDGATLAAADLTSVPEPASLLLLGTGMAIAWHVRRRR